MADKTNVSHASAHAAALAYVRRGWAPVPVPYRQKGPTLNGLAGAAPHRQTAPQYFNGGPLNIGVILGPPRVTCATSIWTAPKQWPLRQSLLPPTIGFGRASTRGAHRLYRAAFPPGTKAALTFDDPIKLRAKPARLVELRNGGRQRRADDFPRLRCTRAASRSIGKAMATACRRPTIDGAALTEHCQRVAPPRC